MTETTSGNWITIRVTPKANRAGVISALFDNGSLGVEEAGAVVITHYPADQNIDEVVSAIGLADPQATVAIIETAAVDYSQWRASVGAHPIGRVVITPPWLASNYDPETVVIVEPAMAFGTGEHQTTRGTMRLMEDVIREGDLVADLGAGSAVLSIAAAKLGAARVAAIELDHDSISNAEANVTANGAQGVVEVIEGDAALLLPLLAPIRVVLANILSSVITPMLPTIRDALTRDGQAILSGMVVDERDDMLIALRANDFIIEREDTEDSWWSVQIAPR